MVTIVVSIISAVCLVVLGYYVKYWLEGFHAAEKAWQAVSEPFAYLLVKALALDLPNPEFADSTESRDFVAICKVHMH